MSSRVRLAFVHNLDRPRKRLAAALAALAGYVDAVGFLSADRYFVSFMSGNTTRLATELVAGPARALAPALLILGFVLGVAAGGVVGHAAGRWRKPAVLGLVTVLLANGALAALQAQTVVMMAALVLAMGALNTTMQQGETPVALTYLTGALVRLGRGLAGRITGQRQEGLRAFALLWLALACGAAAGAAAFLRLGSAALPVATLASALLTWSGARISARS